MISSTTLLFATLVFNVASVLGVPIRIPTAPEVIVRAAVNDPPILPRVDVVDSTPARKRSFEGTTIRPRLAREDASENSARDSASAPLEARRVLPEADKIVRRYPRSVLYEYYEKRAPSPAPQPAPAPSDTAPPAELRSEPEPAVNGRDLEDTQEHVQRSPEPDSMPESRSEEAPAQPELNRRFPRRVYAEYYKKRSATPVADAMIPRKVKTEPEVVRRFPRRVYADYFGKRSAAPAEADANLPREPAPEPAPIPEPVPEPAPVPAPAAVPSAPEPPLIKKSEEQPERRRAYPRRGLAEKYETREESSPPPPPPSEPAPSPSSSPSLGMARPMSESTTTVPGNLDFNKVIADAIVKGNTQTNAQGPEGKSTSYKDTTITIKITHQENSDRSSAKASGTAEPVPAPSSTPSSDQQGGPEVNTPKPPIVPVPAVPVTPPPTTPVVEKEKTAAKPVEGETNPTATTTTTAPAETTSTTSPPSARGENAGGNNVNAGNGPTQRRSLGTDAPSPAAAPAVAKRAPSGGLSGALWATWTRRNLVQN